jgi:hypothetical protein
MSSSNTASVGSAPENGSTSPPSTASSTYGGPVQRTDSSSSGKVMCMYIYIFIYISILYTCTFI